MARNVAVTSLLVALCLVAAVAGHSTYGIGGHRPVVHGSGVLGGVRGGVHGGFHGGVHGAGLVGSGIHGAGLVGSGIHGAGLVGTGIHGAGSFNTAHYPGLVPGYSFYDQRPVLGYNTCKYWCKSNYTNKYYCCQRPYQG
ncbi:holotricin-3-like isoform X10 [Penaeus chinensis]|uniref:holotricin-3-like isoform X10 n=1 Tax=Penaeus chinensis TaxID=139456 RepID=UPI001FB7DFCD|nr:holotricin-3-like isoform X10 [Penaeus chinensis]